MSISLQDSWKKYLAEEFEQDYFKELTQFVREEYEKEEVYPAPKQIFRALDLCPFEDVKVVILGQDPYHGAGQANGLCFAVNKEVQLPRSLLNIYKELSEDLGEALEDHGQVLLRSGDLTSWADQGVLLLNSSLTVRAGEAGSHQKKGWERFTDSVIQSLSDKRENLVFILWGKYAEAKGKNIDEAKHLVIRSPHPSPLSAHRGFFGSRPFSQVNAYLKEKKVGPIKW
jgi:uracil-DNA glycosylase